MKEKSPRTIVGEVSKTWSGGVSLSGDQEPIASSFERMIATNEGRGYELRSWQLQVTLTAAPPVPVMVETIVAVFRRSEVPD